MITVYVWGLRLAGFRCAPMGDMTFPAGMYEAVRVTIGNGARTQLLVRVLYPSLCYTDSIHASMPEGSKETLKSLIPEDDYEALLRSGPQHSPSDEGIVCKKVSRKLFPCPL